MNVWKDSDLIAPLPKNEDARLAALRRYDILDTAPEAAFDDFTRLAAHICGVPTAVVSLVAEDRQWFKARVGMSACQTSRDISFCAHALLQSDVFIIPDAAADPRFADNPMVTGELNVRFYAGAPLITADGHALGALCAIDQVPRTLTAEQQDALQTLARQVVAQLELRRSLAERAEAERALRESQAVNAALLEASLDCIITIDAQERVIEWNPAAEKTFGHPRSQALGQPLSDLIIPEALRAAHRRGMAHFLATGEGPVLNQRIEVPALRADGSEFPAELTALPIRLDDRLLFTAYIRDISERRAAEAARLRTSSVLLAQQEAAIDGILIADETRRVVSYNHRFCELWRIPDGMEDGDEDLAFLKHALTQVRDPAEFLRTLDYLYAHPLEHSHDELPMKDGRVFDRYSGPATGHDGQHYGRVWYFRDITDRKRTEEALREAHDKLEMHVHERTMQLAQAEEDYRSLFENAVDGIFQTRPDGSYLRANPALAALYGYTSPEELMAELRATDLYVEPGRRTEFARLMREQDAVSDFESAVWRRDGTLIWISESSRAIRDEQGEIIRYEGMVVDVTERRRAEEALSQSEVRYRGLVDHSPETIFVYCEDTIVYVNAAALALFGASRPEELLGRCVFDIIHPDTLPVARERARRSQQEGLPSALAEQKYLRLDGSPVDVESVSTAITWEGKAAGQVLARDITERKRAEREILSLNGQLEQRLDRITMLNRELSQAYDATIEGWSRALDLRDKETEGHSQRVTDLTLRLAQAFGFSPDELIHIRRGALLHDIGKMGIPDAILLKPGPLSGEERALMQRHPDYAREMLSPIEFLRPALEIPCGHHEKWDGTGYPLGLAGREIPLSARLFALVDVWDALRSNRPYRSAWSWDRTRDHIASLSDTHFDPQVVRVFLEIVLAETQAEVCPLLAA